MTDTATKPLNIYITERKPDGGATGRSEWVIRFDGEVRLPSLAAAKELGEQIEAAILKAPLA